jgi:hypothetical protein
VLLDAEMRVGAGAPAREASRSGDDGWQGPIFLPRRSSRNNRRCSVFHANLRGYTQTYPFHPSLDALELRPSADSDVLQMLLDSHFTGKEWNVRADATHARSKTHRVARV